MAQQVLRHVPRVVAQLNGKLSALRRQGPARAVTAVQRLRARLQHTADLVRRVIHQNAERFEGRHLPDKVLSLHEPHVVSIRKGKRAKGTEYGSKVSLSIDRHSFVITHTEYACNIADPDTLPATLRGWHDVFGRPPPELAGDRGLHHPGYARARLGTTPIPRLSIPPKGKTRHPEADTALVGDGDTENLGGEVGEGGVSVVIGLTMDVPGDGPDLWVDVRQQSGLAHIFLKESAVDR
jgi:hypothetical protein